MINIFKLSKPYLIPLLVIYTVLLNLNLFFEPVSVIYDANAPLSELSLKLIDWLAGNNYTVVWGLYLVLLFSQALLLNRIVNKYQLLSQLSFLPSFGYVLLVSLFNSYLFMSPAFLANFAILFMLDKTYQSYNDEGFGHLFDMGFAISIASLFYFPTLILVVFMIVALAITRIFNWREWIVALFGVLIPYFLVGTYFLWFDQFNEFVFQHFFAITNSRIVSINGLELVVKLSILLIIIMITMFFFQVQFLKTIVQTRKYLTLSVYLLAISVMAFLLIRHFSFEPVSLALIPISIFFSYTIFKLNNVLTAESLHLALLSTLIVFQYWN
ncbi:MAG: hypothetical protein R3E32_19525 [Chitinophagales bacterium]